MRKLIVCNFLPALILSRDVPHQGLNPVAPTAAVHLIFVLMAQIAEYKKIPAVYSPALSLVKR